jgi:hypothetical protein
MPMIRGRLLLLGALLLPACENDAARSNGAPPPAPGNGPVLITLSDSAPAKGGVVTVHAELRPGAALTVASYSARVTWDRAGLVYLRDLTQGDGLHALNPQPGLVRIAGASTTGIHAGRLFSLEFRVTDPAALTSLELRLGELNGADFRTALPRVALDRVAHFSPAPR